MDTWELIERIAKTEHWVLDDADWLTVGEAFRSIRRARAAGDPAGVRAALAALEPLEQKQPRRVTHTLGPGVRPIGDELNERRSLLIAEVGTDPDEPRESPAGETTR
ncbi:CATRA system-associated protein [Streptomyces sp. NPDC047973]|uniref:CATRA system-associated protein n=1 Tax=Streptomyces sp. NPDC047973 TaxID=3155383 RepID=UPI003445816D